MHNHISLSLPHWTDEFLSKAQKDLSQEEEKVRFVLDLTEQNIMHKTGGPFGAAIFDKESNQLISIGVNRVMPETCCVAHAEMMAIMFAQKKLKTFDLATQGRFQLVTSSKMCIMCLGAVIWSGIQEVIFSADTKDVEQIVGFDEGPVPEHYQRELEKRGIKLKGPIRQEEGKKTLQMYVDLGGFVYNSSSNPLKDNM